MPSWVHSICQSLSFPHPFSQYCPSYIKTSRQCQESLNTEGPNIIYSIVTVSINVDTVSIAVPTAQTPSPSYYLICYPRTLAADKSRLAVHLHQLTCGYGPRYFHQTPSWKRYHGAATSIFLGFQNDKNSTTRGIFVILKAKED